MSDQQETAANTPKEPKLCKMGCGFFGSNATGDYCSKCWNDLRKKQGVTDMPESSADASPVAASIMTTTGITPSVQSSASVAVTQLVSAVTSPPTKKKKKKKKMNFKNMMADMMKETGQRDATKEKESIEKATGGGAFVKIDKI